MYRIALVQNQSEMSHYGYADARPMLKEFGYQFKLYTAQNIGDLSTDLRRSKLDVVLFASNALNDKTIRDVVTANEFRDSFVKFLKSGKGCLVLHQLRMAQLSFPLNFLPSPLDTVVPKERSPSRENEENFSDGRFLPTDITMSNVSFLYPNKIDVDQLKAQCLTFRGLKGLYWHFLDKVSQSDWDVVLYDVDKSKNERPLVIVSKEVEAFRIVVSALTLDWQKQDKILQNILTYVVEGRHLTAILRDSNSVSVPFNYLVDCLKSEKYPFKIYDVRENSARVDFTRNLKENVHTIIIMDPFVKEETLGQPSFSLIEQYVREGKIKLVAIDPDTKLGKFYVAGRERFALRLLYDLEISLQKELCSSTGLIDGSFWSTVESLQILTDMPQIRSKFDRQTLRKTFETSEPRIRNGSYDETFGVTCALLWLRAKYYGKNHADTEKTLTWVRKNLPQYDDREKVLALSTLTSSKLATENERKDLPRILLLQRFDRVSEIDLISYLRAAVLTDSKEILIPIVCELEKKQDNGYWVDLATTASVVTNLLDVLRLLRDQALPSTATNPKPLIESMIFKAIIYIQDSMENPSQEKGIEYPWDNKASTSLKCIQAWLKFEELVDLPVHEIIDAISSYSRIDIAQSSAKTALSTLEELKQDNRKLVQQNERLNAVIELSKRNLNVNRVLWIISLSTLYFLLSLFFYSLIVGATTPLQQIIKGAFLDSWQIHTAVIGLAVAAFGLIPALRKRQEGASKSGL